ncbi:MAG: biotin-dependent carboxyltransferase [Beijerinckiaceae bacterium]|nr:MAG: biotin-dependent carboxyltransferase [Beijerinckiaceae bacterium]
MPGVLEIMRAGVGSTIQDGGRLLYRRYGVTPAGPMDRAAFRTANLALGNDSDAAAIEIGPGWFEICADCTIPVAFCGGAFNWTLDGKALGQAARITLQPGERLAATPGAWGIFSYLAVAGGLATQPVLGSRATHTRAHLGGLDGRMLRDGDRLPLSATSSFPQANAAITAPWLTGNSQPLRVVPGPQDDYFTADALATFFASEFRVSRRTDRMAYRLDGPKITHARDFNIVSDGIAPGAIQIAGDGQPLVLMADHPPTGGYPKLGHVIRADIGRLAQMRAGAACRFAAIDVEAARQAFISQEAAIARICDYLRGAG